ncbi:MAG: hypothetical protein EA397_00810 [Deltaproteobacteria bacterium]|nr:MAG: hypothetical protein EA397_00810 [Deltaproteobacteria bacterium]
MSLFDRIARVARGKVQVLTKGPSEPLDPAVRAEIESLRPQAPPAQSTRSAAPRPVSTRPKAPPPNPAEDPVPRSDLLGDRSAETEANATKRGKKNL